MADYFIRLVIQVIFMQIRESKLYKILYGPLLYLLDFRKRPLVATLTLLGLETIAVLGFVIQLSLIRDTLAIEIMRSIIETDGVLIGFVGLMATVLFTRPPSKEKDFLQATLLCSATSAAFFVFSILCSIFTIAYIEPGFGLRGMSLFLPIQALILGMTLILLFIGFVSGAIPLLEKSKESAETDRISARAQKLKEILDSEQ